MGLRAARVSRGSRAVVVVLLGGACMFLFVASQVGVVFGSADIASAATRVAATSARPPPFVVPAGPDSWFQPSGRNQGTEGLIDFLTRLALHDNAPLYISDSWGRTSGGDNSDHHVTRSDSWAVDLAVLGIQHPTAATETAAARIATALGEPGWTGGDMRKTIAGYRVQVLWKVAGHYNHVHVGIRKVA